MRIKLLGRYWQFRFARMRGQNDGTCDQPTKPHKEIRVAAGLEPKRELYCTVHEATHACDWSKDEEWVVEFSRDLTDLLWRLGYRRLTADR